MSRVTYEFLLTAGKQCKYTKLACSQWEINLVVIVPKILPLNICKNIVTRVLAFIEILIHAYYYVLSSDAVSFGTLLELFI